MSLGIRVSTGRSLNRTRASMGRSSRGTRAPTGRDSSQSRVSHGRGRHSWKRIYECYERVVRPRTNVSIIPWNTHYTHICNALTNLIVGVLSTGGTPLIIIFKNLKAAILKGWPKNHLQDTTQIFCQEHLASTMGQIKLIMLTTSNTYTQTSIVIRYTEMKSPPYKKSWRRWRLFNKLTRSVVGSRSVYEKKPELNKRIYGKKPETNKSAYGKRPESPRVTTRELHKENNFKAMQITSGDTWMTPYARYLADGLLSSKPMEDKIVKKNASQHTCWTTTSFDTDIFTLSSLA